MLIKNNELSVRIVKRLELRRFYFGNEVTWHWRRPWLARSLEFKRRMNPHVVIVGESGSGKSNACRLLISMLCGRGARVIVLDPNSDYLGIADSIGADVYDASYNGINIFDLDNMSENERVSDLMTIFKNRFRLGYVQASVLRRCITYTYRILGQRGRTPTLRDLLYTIKVFQRKAGGSESRILDTLLDRMSLLNTGAFVKNTDLDKAMKRNSIFLLSRIHTEEAQSIYMEGLLRKIYSRMLTMDKSFNAKTYVVVDEARKLKGSQVLGRLAAESRKYGVGIITVAQRSKELDKDILTNSSLFISFYQREPEELNYIANFIAGGTELNRFREVKKAVRSLGIGHAIVLDSGQTEPLVVRFSRCMERGASLGFTIVDKAREGIRKDELMGILTGCGFGLEEVEMKMDELLRSETLHSHEVRLQSDFDGVWYIAMQRNSPEHDLSVKIISMYLKGMGLESRIYNSSYGPDLILFSGDSRIAVEYETGSKSREQMEEMVRFRQRSYNEVIVVTNENAIEKYAVIDGIRLFTISSFLKSRPF